MYHQNKLRMLKNHRKIGITLFSLLTVLLACNLPLRGSMVGLTPDELRSTLEALESNRTQVSTISSGQTPVPTLEIPFMGLATATPQDTFTAYTPSPIPEALPGMVRYFAQSGDTLPVLSKRFEVSPGEIQSEFPIPQEGLIPPGQILFIPGSGKLFPYPSAVLPDSEVIYSPSTIGFSTEEYVRQAGGYLANYQETVHGETLSGAGIVQLVAELTSTNPRFLLAFIEQRSGWVFGQLADPEQLKNPLGYQIVDQNGLYRELSIAANQLNAGFYGWRGGTLTEIEFPDKTRSKISPDLNAGSAAVQRLFAQFYRQAEWERAVYGEGGLTELHTEMFGDPWERAAVVEPLLPAGLAQPVLELPFLPGERWALTGGPHYSWNAGSPRGALDFSPITGNSGCYLASSWATASAPGLVVRTGEGIVVLDLDGDGYEQTGWVLFYLHLAEKDRVKVGDVVELDQPLGHPSCEGGITTGTHLHIARKYNGEWLYADVPLPFILSGWQAKAGDRNYAGFLTKEGQVVSANPGGSRTSVIER
jgi:LasA protease